MNKWQSSFVAIKTSSKGFGGAPLSFESGLGCAQPWPQETKNRKIMKILLLMVLGRLLLQLNKKAKKQLYFATNIKVKQKAESLYSAYPIFPLPLFKV
jgi:hypothetical protein